MTPEKLRELIAAGETLEIELKGEERGRLSDGDMVEAVVCLANRPGSNPGWLLVGVEDDGRVTGARPRHGNRTDPLRLQALIGNRTRPSLSVRAEVVELDALPVVAIEVPAALTPVGTTDGRYVRRAVGHDGKPACLPYHFHEMQAQSADRGRLDPSALVVAGACWDDLDPLEIERLRRTISESGQGDAALLALPDLELAKAIGAVEANHDARAVRLLGLLLFGRERALARFVPTHEVAFQVLAGGKVAVNEIFRWPLLRLMDELGSRFRARNQEEELMVGLFRVGVPDFPERAFREAVANALVHRDYSRLGAVHVQWLDDRLEISSPGGFPEGVHLGNLLTTPPRPRNPLLADAFKRAGLVERTGRGIDTIFYEQLRHGRPAPSYERSTPTDVVLVLPGGGASLDFARLVVEESRAGRTLSLDELLVLNKVWLDRSVTTPEAARLVQKPEPEARARLQGLVEAGLVEARGERKGRSYHLSAATYRRLGQKAAYVRQRGFEQQQQEQMVVQYVQAHGRIARRDAADLCRLSSAQARDLLARLVRKGLILQREAGRRAFYVLAHGQ
ncbi:MAG: putative DNA binding domain-containing protein [Deltaproteobacteria bacterium]|nr:putative DNA binding domain-containing protein [Deltaproteobacteria bacterium]